MNDLSNHDVNNNASAGFADASSPQPTARNRTNDNRLCGGVLNRLRVHLARRDTAACSLDISSNRSRDYHSNPRRRRLFHFQKHDRMLVNRRMSRKECRK